MFSSTESKNSEDLKITDAGDNLKCMIGEQKIVHKRFQNGALVELTVHQKLNTVYLEKLYVFVSFIRVGCFKYNVKLHTKPTPLKWLTMFPKQLSEYCQQSQTEFGDSSDLEVHLFELKPNVERQTLTLEMLPTHLVLFLGEVDVFAAP